MYGPVNADNNGAYDNDQYFIWNEKQDYVLQTPLFVNVHKSKMNPFSTTVDGTSGASGTYSGTIPAGTCISSHVMHTDGFPDTPGPPYTYRGTGFFKNQILGVNLIGEQLNVSDHWPRQTNDDYLPFQGNGPTNPGTIFATEEARDVDNTNSDYIVVQNFAVEINFETFDTVDEIRVITEGCKKEVGLQVFKRLLPASDPGRFNLQIDGVTEAANAGNNSFTPRKDLDLGSTHTIGETAGTGTNLANYTSEILCQAYGETQYGLFQRGVIGYHRGPGPMSLTLNSSDWAQHQIKRAFCEITNSRETPGRVIVRKDAVPNDPTDFELYFGATSSYAPDPTSPALERFTLDDDPSDGTYSNTRTFDGLVARGGYSVGEFLSCGLGDQWRCPTTSCDDGSDPSNINVSPGETVTCTVTNRRQGLEVRKQLLPASDPGRFDLQIDGQTHKANAGDGDTTHKVAVTDGTHTVREVASPGTNLADYASDIECRRNDGNGEVVATANGPGPVSVDVAGQPYDGIVCTISNSRERGTLIVRKDAVPDDDQDFHFSASGGLAPSQFDLDDDSDPTLSNTKTFLNLVAKGGYSVTEVVPEGWRKTDATCNGGGGDPSNITIAANAVVTCTFTNKAYTIDVTPDSAVNDPGTQHCVTATVKFGGVASPNEIVRLEVTGLNTTSGRLVTNASGVTPQFCWTSPVGAEGDDSIVGFTDANDNGFHETWEGEVADTAVKCWTPDGGCGGVRPKGATPIDTSLVVAYKACLAPNRKHGPPLDSDSCAAPQQESDYLTVGTADANARPVKSTGRLRMSVLVGRPTTGGEDSDVRLTSSVTDVRNKSDLSDYPGELLARVSVRMTDRLNGASRREKGTMQDYPFSFPIPCAPTTDTTVGSTCSVATSADTLVPGLVIEGKRAIWAAKQVEVEDGGADGLWYTPGNTTFLREGIFIP